MSHICMSHVAYVNEPHHDLLAVLLHITESGHTCEWVMSHVWLSHVVHMHESCCHCKWATPWLASCPVTYDWVMSHMWLSRVAYIHESCRICEGATPWLASCVLLHITESWHTCEWVMSHVWLSHFVHMHESCCHCKWATPWLASCPVRNDWVTARVWLSHVAHVHESCRLYARVMSHIRHQGTYDWVISHMCMKHVANVIESRHGCATVMSHMLMSHTMTCYRGPYWLQTKMRNPTVAWGMSATVGFDMWNAWNSARPLWDLTSEATVGLGDFDIPQPHPSGHCGNRRIPSIPQILPESAVQKFSIEQ